MAGARRSAGRCHMSPAHILPHAQLDRLRPSLCRIGSSILEASDAGTACAPSTLSVSVAWALPSQWLHHFSVSTLAHVPCRHACLHYLARDLPERALPRTYALPGLLWPRSPKLDGSCGCLVLFAHLRACAMRDGSFQYTTQPSGTPQRRHRTCSEFCDMISSPGHASVV